MLWSVPCSLRQLYTCFSFVSPFVQTLVTPVVCSPFTECRVGCPPEHLNSSGAGTSGERSRSALPGGGGERQFVATGAGWSATRRTVSHSSEGVRDGCMRVCEGVRL